MTQILLPAEAAPDLWKDNIWDRLLDSLDERTVIPIVGPDLLCVEIDGNKTLLSEYIARRLALAYQLPTDQLPAERPLNSVVCQLLHHRKDRYAICDDIFQIMKEAPVRPSKSLRQLAEITDFNDIRFIVGEGNQRSAFWQHTRNAVDFLLTPESGRSPFQQGKARPADRLPLDGQTLRNRKLRHF